jgi:hypothetical protein
MPCCCSFNDKLDLVVRVRSKRIFKNKGIAYVYCLGIAGSTRADVQLIFRFAPDESKNTDEHERVSEHISLPESHKMKYRELIRRPAPPEIRTGDVLSVAAGVVVNRNEEISQPCLAGNFLQSGEKTKEVEIFVFEFQVAEPWEESFGNTLVKSRSGGNNPQSRCLIFHPPVVLHPPMPIAIIQCSAVLTERVQALLGGSAVVPMASTLTKDRLLYIRENNAVFNDLFPSLAGLSSVAQKPIPLYLHSVFRRVYAITEAAVPSFHEAVSKLCTADELRGVSSRTAPRLMAFPRELENKVFEAREALHVDQKAQQGMAASDSSTAEDSLKACAIAKQAIPTTCDTLVYADGRYWLGISCPRLLLPERPVDVPSAAYWKLIEIDARYAPMSCDCTQKTTVLEKYGKCANAIDVGASPGGWSYCLASVWGVQHVIAVDPASYMHPLLNSLLSQEAQQEDCADAMALTEHQMGQLGSQERAAAKALRTAPEFEQLRKAVGETKVAKEDTEASRKKRRQQQQSARIDHWRMKAEEALVEENDDCLAGLYTSTGVYVCDMNVPCEDTVAGLARFLKLRERFLANTQVGTGMAGTFERQNTLVVLTFKNITKGTWLKQKADSIKRLTDELRVENLQELHLFANTKNECTIVGEFVHASAAQLPCPPQPPVSARSALTLATSPGR